MQKRERTFKLAIGDVGRMYVYKFVDGSDKNHWTYAAGNVTDDRTYELPGTVFMSYHM